MKHRGTKTLETPRLELRQFVIDDYELFYNNWAKDERVTKYMTWSAHPNKELTKQLVAEWVDNYKNDDFYQWAIVLKEIDEPVGSLSVVRIDEVHEVFEVGYCLGYKYWNKGFMTEALKTLINYAFNEINIKAIRGVHDSRNIASGKVMEKCGLKYIESRDETNKGESIVVRLYELENKQIC